MTTPSTEELLKLYALHEATNYVKEHLGLETELSEAFTTKLHEYNLSLEEFEVLYHSYTQPRTAPTDKGKLDNSPFPWLKYAGVNYK